jgi:[citrate (pro-3S)-lyase] ligase
MDFTWGRYVLLDLVLNPEIVVDLTIGNMEFTGICPYENLYIPAFYAENINHLTSDSNVLILSSDNAAVELLKTKTEKIHNFMDLWSDSVFNTIIGNYFTRIQEKNPFLPIVIFPFPHFPRNKAQYSEMEKQIINKYSDTKLPNMTSWGGTVSIPLQYEKFGYEPCDIVEMLETPNSYIDGNQLKLTNRSGKYVNIVNNHRVVPNANQNAEKTIYVFGACAVFGIGCPDGGTLPAYLQQFLLDNDLTDYRVENYGDFTFRREIYFFNRMKAINFKPGDILISEFSVLAGLPSKDLFPEGIFIADTYDEFERPHKWGDNIYFDNSHPNEHGQKAIASVLFDFLKEKNFFADFAKKKKAAPDNNLKPAEIVELEDYKAQIRKLRPRIGAIVMNCNPFTLGHRHLIEYASGKTERLFIFVVEEDKSFFPFADRLELVKKGTADLDNVTVLPSGKFIISSLTFTDYFAKSEIQDRAVDPSMDIELFARQIAPTLGINIRFAGEEPLDNVTRQYNEEMARILPDYGVDFEVIPRKEQGGGVISASLVRKYLEEKDFDSIAELVPETTLEYLLDKF